MLLLFVLEIVKLGYDFNDVLNSLLERGQGEVSIYLTFSSLA